MVEFLTKNDKLTKAEVCRILGCSGRAVDRAVKAGKIRAFWVLRVGKAPIRAYDPSDVAALKDGRDIPTVIGVASTRRTAPDGLDTVVRALIDAKTQPLQPVPLFLSIRDAAGYAGLSMRSIRRLVTEGTLPSVRDGRHVKIPRPTLDWLSTLLPRQAASGRSNHNIE